LIYLDLETPISDVQNHLLAFGWLIENEQIENIEKPGEGNMNVVLRVKTNLRSFIIKQSRPYVQKYQQIDAPLDRITVEYQFYNSISPNGSDIHFPKILAFDAAQFLLMQEDLGNCRDMSYLYNNRKIPHEQLITLVKVINRVHNASVTKDYPENKELRRLNHQHMFVLPFLEDNGFQLDDVQQGLQRIAAPYKTNPRLKTDIKAIGEKYLSKGTVLLHGDYYPGSWMEAIDTIFVIDPEFSFVGFAEFDLGVLAAHCILITNDTSCLNVIAKNYKDAVDQKLLMQLAGIEIMRRIIGLAQLPLTRTLEEKTYLLQLAHKLILS